MSCTSCGHIGGAEFFTNYTPAPTPAQTCTRGQSCQYTAQGELVCGTAPVRQEPSRTGTPLYEGFSEDKKRYKSSQ